MNDPDFVHLLKSMNADSEVWWDSSPTRYATFKQQLSDRYPAVRDYINQLLPGSFACCESGISGATTNPRLVTSAILDESSHWGSRIRGLAQNHNHNQSAAYIQRRVYAELIGKGAALLHNLWQHTRHRQGWLSAQVDAIDIHSAERMVGQGTALARIAPNVMIKVPGSQAGYAAIEQLVAQGCSINNTFCFSVSQFAAGLRAIRLGRETARRMGRDVSAARYVITFMIGRFGAESLLDSQAQALGIRLTPSDKRWAEIAIYQAIQALLKQSGSPARLLISSIKVDAGADGVGECWHLEKTGESETRYTLTPEIIEFLVQRQHLGRALQPATATDIPRDVLHRLMKLAYFRDAWFEGAIAVEDFARQPAFIRACHEACLAHRRLADFVQRSRQSVCRAEPLPSLVALSGEPA